MPSYIATFIGSGGTVLKTPTADGTSGQFMQTDGSGQLSFADAGVDVTADYVWTGGHEFQANVGIGTDTPTEKLHIEQGNLFIQTTAGSLNIKNSGSASVIADAVGFIVYNSTTGVQFGVNNSQEMRVRATGVGIGPGINIPLSRFHIHDGDFTQSENSTTSIREVFTRVTSWVDSTDATRKGRIDFNVYDTAAREFMSAEASGTAPKLSFFGVAPVTRPQVTAAGVSAADLLTALDSLGILESV